MLVKPDNRLGITGDVVRRNAAAGAFIHQLANAAGKVADDRNQSVPHRFEQRQGQAFVFRGEQEDIMFGHDPGNFRVRNGSKKRDGLTGRICQAHLPQRDSQPGRFGPFTDDRPMERNSR